MKKSILILIVLVICIACDKNEKKDNSEAYNKELQEVYGSSSFLTPPDFNDILFNVDLKKANYQPLHVEICENRGFAILGKFDKTNIRPKKNLIHFYLLNAYAKDSAFLKIERVVRYNEKQGDTIRVAIEMEITDENMEKPVPLVFYNTKLEKDYVIDLHLELNDEEYFCAEEDTENPRGKGVGNHICKSIITVED